MLQRLFTLLVLIFAPELAAVDIVEADSNSTSKRYIAKTHYALSENESRLDAIQVATISLKRAVSETAGTYVSSEVHMINGKLTKNVASLVSGAFSETTVLEKEFSLNELGQQVLYLSLSLEIDLASVLKTMHVASENAELRDKLRAQKVEMDRLAKRLEEVDNRSTHTSATLTNYSLVENQVTDSVLSTQFKGLLAKQRLANESAFRQGVSFLKSFVRGLNIEVSDLSITEQGNQRYNIEVDYNVYQTAHKELNDLIGTFLRGKKLKSRSWEYDVYQAVYVRGEKPKEGAVGFVKAMMSCGDLRLVSNLPAINKEIATLDEKYDIRKLSFYRFFSPYLGDIQVRESLKKLKFNISGIPAEELNKVDKVEFHWEFVPPSKRGQSTVKYYPVLTENVDRTHCSLLSI